MNVFTMIFLMKGISFTHVLHNIRFYISVFKNETEYNKEYLERQVSSQNKAIIMKNLNNFEDYLNAKDYLYFMIAPTFCYQLTYPRSVKIRKTWLIKRTIELILVQSFQFFITIEYYMPIIRKSPSVFVGKEINFIYFLEATKFVI